MNEMAQTVVELIAEQLGLKVESIKPTHFLKDDLMMDELHMVELIMGLEEEFEIEINDDSFEALSTVQDVINFIVLDD